MDTFSYQRSLQVVFVLIYAWSKNLYGSSPNTLIVTCKMSSTSQKHRNFVMEPMGEKPVTELAGIGAVLGGRLVEAGFDYAYVVLGQFLVLKKDEDMFKDWIKDTCAANSKQQNDCFQCLKEWCDQFL